MSRLRSCAACGQPIEQHRLGRPREYCGHVCQQRSWEARRRRDGERGPRRLAGVNDAIADPNRAGELAAAFQEYGRARLKLWSVLGEDAAGVSFATWHQDPLLKAVEELVQSLLGGYYQDVERELGSVLVLPDGREVYVDMLVNRASRWRHQDIEFPLDYDLCVLVLVEDFAISGVVAFPPSGAERCYTGLDGAPLCMLRISPRWWHRVRTRPDEHRAQGYQIWLPPFSPESARIVAADPTGAGVSTGAR
jgi:hypothetical protein